MASSNHPLAHRTISSIRTSTTGTTTTSSSTGLGTSSLSTIPASPQTPTLRSSAYGSPTAGVASGVSSLRSADEEVVVVELGARGIRVGLAGDWAPRAGTTHQPGAVVDWGRRAGDFRRWLQPGGTAVTRQGAAPKAEEESRDRDDGGSDEDDDDSDWGREHELYGLDLRGVDLGLVGDRVERGLREAFTKHLLIDSRPRRMTLVLPSTLPLPLLSSVLDALFVRLSAPSVSLVSSAASTTLAAGVRSALVVDVGWHEAVVTAVYEFREVSAGPVRTSVRAGRMLVRKVRAMLDAKAREEWTRRGGEGGAPTFGFEECEEVATRFVWCRRRADGADEKDEQDDLESSTTPIEIPGPAGSPPGFAIRIPFNGLSEPCEATFFGSSTSGASRIFDDHELPLHLLVYRALLQLPVDVRAVCMSRIIFVGGCARILGLRARVMNEVMRLAERHQWDPVTGKGYDKVKANPRLKRGSGSGINGGNQAHQPDGNGAAFAEQEPDEIEERILRTNSGGNKSQAEPPVKGVLRCIDSLGPWAGASLLTPLKIPTLAQVERDAWLQHGAAGASRPADVDIRTQQRQSMGPTGLIRGTASGAGGAASGANWTLGVWGTQA